MSESEIDSRKQAAASVAQALVAIEAQTADLSFFVGNIDFKNNFNGIALPYAVKNLGATRAKQIEVLVESRPVHPDQRIVFSYKHDPWKIEIPLMEGGAVEPDMYVGEEKGTAEIPIRTSEGSFIHANDSIALDYLAHKVDFVVYSEIRFTDMFGIKHWDRSCKIFQLRNLGEKLSDYYECAAYSRSDTNRVLDFTPAKPILPTPQVLKEIPCVIPTKE